MKFNKQTRNTFVTNLIYLIDFYCRFHYTQKHQHNLRFIPFALSELKTAFALPLLMVRLRFNQLYSFNASIKLLGTFRNNKSKQSTLDPDDYRYYFHFNPFLAVFFCTSSNVLSWCLLAIPTNSVVVVRAIILILFRGNTLNCFIWLIASSRSHLTLIVVCLLALQRLTNCSRYGFAFN